ncbi:hypothetical protein HRbin16_01696 [bacterium HR16]|nr:hypothetical protein HRbin16_01696 [bacterium HR16]
MHLVIPLITEEGDLWIILTGYHREDIAARLDRIRTLAQQLDENQSILWRMPVVVIDREVIPVLDMPHLDRAMEEESPILIDDNQWNEVTDLLGDRYLWKSFLQIEYDREGNHKAQVIVPRYDYEYSYPVDLSTVCNPSRP